MTKKKTRPHFVQYKKKFIYCLIGSTDGHCERLDIDKNEWKTTTFFPGGNHIFNNSLAINPLDEEILMFTYNGDHTF